MQFLQQWKIFLKQFRIHSANECYDWDESKQLNWCDKKRSKIFWFWCETKMFCFHDTMSTTLQCVCKPKLSKFDFLSHQFQILMQQMHLIDKIFAVFGGQKDVKHSSRKSSGSKHSNCPGLTMKFAIYFANIANFKSCEHYSRIHTTHTHAHVVWWQKFGQQNVESTLIYSLSQ